MSDDKKHKPDEIWVTQFTESSAQKFREQMHDKAKYSKDKPLVIYIDSYGGYVDSLAKMIATMDELPNPKITVCMGKAMSCGAVLLSHGDYRYCDKHSRVMVHEVSGGSGGDVHDMFNDAVETKRLNEYWLGLLAENSGMKNYSELRSYIKDQDGRDRFFDAKQSLEFGIVDAIGTPEIIPIVQYQIGKRETKPYVLEGGRGAKKTTKAKPQRKTTKKKTKRTTRKTKK